MSFKGKRDKFFKDSFMLAAKRDFLGTAKLYLRQKFSRDDKPSKLEIAKLMIKTRFKK